jgi:guanylate kinase
MIPLTPTLKKQIEDRGEKIHYVTPEQFQEIMSKGTVLSNQEVQEKFFKKP